MSDLDRVKKLAGILNEDYQYDMSDKGDMHDALNDVQNIIDGATAYKKPIPQVQIIDELKNFTQMNRRRNE